MKVLVLILAIFMVALMVSTALLAKEVMKIKTFIEEEDETMGQIVETMSDFTKVCNGIGSMTEELCKVVNGLTGSGSNTESNDEELEEWLK